jgi:hypothetical protein
MAEPVYRMLPPPSSGGATIKISGRSASVAVDSYLDVPEHVARRLAGWVNCGQVGATSARPANAKANDHFYDTTLSAVVFYDGAGNWRDPASGATA